MTSHLEDLLRRDLDAWLLAKAVIERVRRMDAPVQPPQARGIQRR